MRMRLSLRLDSAVDSTSAEKPSSLRMLRFNVLLIAFLLFIMEMQVFLRVLQSPACFQVQSENRRMLQNFLQRHRNVLHSRCS